MNEMLITIRYHLLNLPFFFAAKIERKLALFYLANDVVQNSRKKSKDFVMFFGKAFKETISHLQ